MGTIPRGYGPRVDLGGLLTPAIKWLLIANTAVFFVQTAAHLVSPEAYNAIILWFGLVPFFVTHDFAHVFRFWQPFTYLFLHGGLWHIVVNMFVLWMFGRDLERTWGRRRFLGYYFLTGAGAGIVNVIVKTMMDFSSTPSAVTGLRPSEIPVIGASGAIYGVLMGVAILFPDRQIWLIPFPITMPMRAYVFVIGLISFFGTLGSTGPTDNVSHLTHLSGLLIGYFYLRRGSFLYRLRNRFTDWRRARARRKFTVYLRDHKDEPPSRPDNWVN